jgi:hypothetical protein
MGVPSFSTDPALCGRPLEGRRPLAICDAQACRKTPTTRLQERSRCHRKSNSPDLPGERSKSAGREHLSPGLVRSVQFLLRRRLRTLQQKVRDLETVRGPGKMKTLGQGTTDVTQLRRLRGRLNAFCDDKDVQVVGAGGFKGR